MKKLAVLAFMSFVLWTCPFSRGQDWRDLPPAQRGPVELLCEAFFGIEGDSWQRVKNRLDHYDEVAGQFYGLDGYSGSIDSPHIVARSGQFAMVGGVRYEVVSIDRPALALALVGEPVTPGELCRAVAGPDGTLVDDCETIFKVLFVVEAREIVDNIARSEVPASLHELADNLDNMSKWHMTAQGTDLLQTGLSEGLAMYVTKSKKVSTGTFVNEYTINNLLGFIAEAEMSRVATKLREVAGALERYPVAGDYTEISMLYEHVTDLVEGRIDELRKFAEGTFPAYDENVMLYTVKKAGNSFKGAIMNWIGKDLKNTQWACETKMMDKRLSFETVQRLADRAKSIKETRNLLKFYGNVKQVDDLVKNSVEAFGGDGPLGQYYLRGHLHSEYVPMYQIYAEARRLQLMLGGLLNASGQLRQGLAIAMVIDRSGSMQGAKLKEAKNAARALVRFLGQQDEVTVITFENSAKVSHPLVSLADTSARKRVLGAIDAIVASGGTEFGAALSTAIAELENSPRKISVLFLSDGKAKYPAPQVARLAQLRAPVFTIAFGSDAEETVLRQMAKETKGQFFPAGSENLKQVFILIGGRARGYSDLLVERGLIRPGEEKWTELTLTATTEMLTLVLGWQGSDVNLLVERPGCEVISSSRFAGMSGITLEYSPQEHTRTLRIENAEAGNWRIGVVGTDVPQDGELYSLTASCKEKDAVVAEPFLPAYPPGSPVDLRLYVPAQRADKTRVSALVIAPDGSRQQVDLGRQNAGEFGDSYAGGKKSGFYRVVYTVTDTATGATRYVRSVFQVGSVAQIKKNPGYFQTPASTSSGPSQPPASGISTPVLILLALVCACCVLAALLLLVVRRKPGGATSVVIGRAPGCAIVLDHPSVSSRHCEIFKTGDQLIIRDLQSTNGTQVNGVACTSKCKFEPGDRIVLGELPLNVSDVLRLLR